MKISFQFSVSSVQQEETPFPQWPCASTRLPGRQHLCASTIGHSGYLPLSFRLLLRQPDLLILEEAHHLLRLLLLLEHARARRYEEMVRIMEPASGRKTMLQRGSTL